MLHTSRLLSASSTFLPLGKAPISNQYADARNNSVGLTQSVTTDIGTVQFRFSKDASNGTYSARVKLLSDQPTIDGATEFQIDNLSTETVNATLRWHKAHPNQKGAGAPKLYVELVNFLTTMAPLETKPIGILTKGQSEQYQFALQLGLDVDYQSGNYKMRFSNSEEGGRQLGQWLYQPCRSDSLSVAGGMLIASGQSASLASFFPAGFKPSAAFLRGLNDVGNELNWATLGEVAMNLASIPMRRGSVPRANGAGYRARINPNKKRLRPPGTVSLGIRQNITLKPFIVNGFVVQPLR